MPPQPPRNTRYEEIISTSSLSSRKLINSGVDIRFVYANYDKSSAGVLHIDIDGVFVGHHSRVTGEKVTIATWNLRNKGVCTCRAPIGYLNNGTMTNKPFDPVKVLFINGLLFVCNGRSVPF